MKIFGVRVDEVSLDEAVRKVLGAKKHPFFIVTPNPEQIVQAQEDEEFRKILNSADLAIPDGLGLRWAGVKTRVTGIELMEALVKKGKRVMFVGGSRGAAEKTARKLGGYGWEEPEIDKINQYRPDFLFVGLGAPKQEKWVVKNLDKLDCKVVMVVGGAIDQIADPSLRPPKWLDQIGLGWFYRLLRQPWRWQRQLRLMKFVGMLVDKALRTR